MRPRPLFIRDFKGPHAAMMPSLFTNLLDAQIFTSFNQNRTALIYLETDQAPLVLSRADFKHSVLDYANVLGHLGLAPRDLVIIAHTQNLESMFIFWAALAMGAIPSMFPTLTEKLDPQIYMANMAQLVTHSGAKAIFTTDDFAPQLASHVSCAVYGSSVLHSQPTPGTA